MPRVLFAGLTTIDIQFFVDKFPHPNEKVKGSIPTILVGGPALNAAVGHAFLAGNSDLLTAVGEHSFSSFIQDDLGACNVNITDFHAKEPTSPVIACAITSPNGDRSVLSHHPTNHSLSIDIAALLDATNPDLILIDGFYPNVSLKLCEEAGLKAISVVLDGGSWKTHLEELLPHVDIAICSADFLPPYCKNATDVENYLVAHGIKRIAITRGAESILFYENGRRGEVAVPTIKITDSLGAGDFFHGAFCYYWAKTFDFEWSLKRASLFASETCMYPGTRSCFKSMSKEQFF